MTLSFGGLSIAASTAGLASAGSSVLSELPESSIPAHVADPPSSVVSSSSLQFPSDVPSATPQSISIAPPPALPSAMPGSLGGVVGFFFQTIPSILFWVIGFTSITVPTYIFTVLSMSLTFTMQFRTLYVSRGRSEGK